MKRIGIGLLLVALALPVFVSAQGPDDCPANVLLALARAGAACQRMERGQACYGSGTAQIDPVGAFDAPGALADAAAITRLAVSREDGGDFGVAVIKIAADLPPTEQRSVTVLLINEAAIQDDNPRSPTLTVTATATPYIRAAPRGDGDILGRMRLRETITATGRTADGAWLRVLAPDTGAVGWVSAEVVTAEGGLSALDVVDEATPFYRPFQDMQLYTGAGDAWCGGTPESGVLVQSPGQVNLTINGVQVRLSGTVFVQAAAGETMAFSVLNGEAEIVALDTLRFVPAGAQVSVPLSIDLKPAALPESPAPYEAALVGALPVNNLPFRFNPPPPLVQAEIDTALAAHFAPTPTPAPAADEGGPESCVRVTNRSADLRAGPGTSYEVVNSVPRGTQVRPVVRVLDADGIVWWELRNSNWIRADAVTSTGNCPDVPLTDQVETPGCNYLSLETCTTRCGPLRPDQWVWIDFVPPAWPTLVEAQEAPRIDPGRITVNDWLLWVWPSRPVRIAEERYVVTFGAYWYTEPGTFRIIGKRLSYEVICDITVPLGN